MKFNRNFELPAILCVKSFFLDINICTSKSWAGFWRCILKTGRGLFNCFYIAFLCKNFRFPIVLFFCGAVVLFKHLVDFADEIENEWSQFVVRVKGHLRLNDAQREVPYQH